MELGKFAIPKNWLKYLWIGLSSLLTPVISDLPGKLAPQLAAVLTQTQWLRVSTALLVLLLVAISYIVYLIVKFEKPYESAFKETFVDAGRLKWKVQYLGEKVIKIQEEPYCKEHGLRFVSTDGEYRCPYCTKEQIPYHELVDIYAIAESIIEKEIKGKNRKN